MYQKETKICQNCKQNFQIEPEDFQFYEKIKVPPPTWCPECRIQRRLSFLNFINLYKRKCDLCKRNFIAGYHPDAPVVVYCPECWWSDKWDPRDFGKDYNFSKPFFEQFQELSQRVPIIGIAIDLAGALDSPYNNYAGNLKQCYFLSEADEDEDSAYGVYVFYSKSIYDSSLVQRCDTCYDSMNIYKVSYGVGLRNQVYESSHCSFLRDCYNCQDCFASANLRNKQYYIFNKQYSKEEYLDLVVKIRKHMDEIPYQDKQGRIYRYGEFFPSEFSPHGYNESVAYNMHPLNKEEAVRQGFLWREKPQLYHKIDREASDLPDHIKDVADDILQEVIRCEQCQKGYRIIPNELSFLRRRNLPLPRRCPLCRINEKLDIWMQELKSVKGRCTRCSKEIELPALHSSEKVILCKQCYQTEVV